MIISYVFGLLPKVEWSGNRSTFAGYRVAAAQCNEPDLTLNYKNNKVYKIVFSKKGYSFLNREFFF